MFDDLLESRIGRRRRGGVAALSIAAHAVAITLAAAAPHGPPDRPAPSEHANILYHPAAPSVPLPPGGGGPTRRGPGRTVVAPSTPSDLPAPPDVSIDLGPVTIGARVDGESLDAVPTTRGGGSGAPVPDAGGVYHVVERAAAPLPGAPMARYPEALRQVGVEGEAVLRFVVDTSGRVEAGSVAVVRSTRAQFAESARRALAGTRFAPAEAGGRRVRQLVEQGFTFTLAR